MKQLFRITFFLASFFSMLVLQAQQPLRKFVSPTRVSLSSQHISQMGIDETLSLSHSVAAFYEHLDGELGNYYLILSQHSDACFDAASGELKAKNDRLLVLDLYGTPGTAPQLPEGTYQPGEGGAMTYITDNSMVLYYGANGEQTGGAEVDGAVTVVQTGNDTYTLSTRTLDGTTYTYSGRLVFVDVSATHAYPQINADINAAFSGGLAIYHGNVFDNNTGNIYINLYDCDFDPETGGMNDKGYNFAICAINRRFVNPKDATVVPGTYDVSQSLKSNTFYPGIELDYMGTTVVFGSYVKRRKSLNNDGNDYDYAYIQSGTMTITEGELPNTFNFVIDCKTDNGFEIKGEGKNIEIPVIDMSDDKPSSAVSNLTQDVKLDQDYIKVCRAYYNGVENNCNRFIIDIGSPSGKDGDEGDILRMEFLTDLSAREVPMGTYEVMEYGHLYTNLFAPFKLVQGYFYGGGDTAGTRYQHFEEGRYCVVDLYAFITSGRVSIEKVEGTDNYKFSIDFADGNGCKVQGEWTGPMELCYNPEVINGINDVTEDANGRLTWGYSDANTLQLSGVATDVPVEIVGLDGKTVRRVKSSTIDVTGLAHGVYILKVGNRKPVKFVRK